MYLLWYFFPFIISVKCQENVKDGPDITLLSSANDKGSISHTCVAGSEVDSALVFITPFRENFRQNSVSYVNEDYNCDFEAGNKCTDLWMNNNNFAIKSSLDENFIIGPIIDKRWEKFQTFSKNTSPIKFSENGSNIWLSVRAKTEAYIFLCSDYKRCHWVISLNEKNDGKVQQILSYCENMNIENFKLLDAGCTKHKTHEVTVKITKNKWTHIFVSKNPNNNFYTLKRYEDKIKSHEVQYEIAEISSIKIMYPHLNNENGQWKFHNYSYLSINQDTATDNWYDLGPTFQNNNEEICVELYAAICAKCSLIVGFNGKAVEQIPNNLKNQWYYKKLIVPNVGQQHQLQIKASCTNCENSEKFWYIDDVRRCRANESRKISVSASEKDEIACVVLQNQQWKISNKGGEVKSQSSELCENSTYIGKNCDISCSSVLGPKYNFCNKHTICVPSKGSTSQCSCAAGYYGKNCSEICPQGFYGNNCLKICKPCKKFCLSFSGNCPAENKCSSKDDDKGCIISELLPILAAPIIEDATLKTIAVTPNISHSKNLNIEYQIEYRVQNMEWKQYGKKEKISNLKTAIITNLTPLTIYNIRTVLYYQNESTRVYDHIHSTTETICSKITPATKFYENLSTNASPIEVVIYWTSICNGKIKFRISAKNQNLVCPTTIQTNYIEITKEKVDILDLVPDTEYELEVIIVNDNSDEMSYDPIFFKTKEFDLPVLRSPPKVISTNLHEIKIQFFSQDVIRAELVSYYAIQIKHQSSQWTNQKIEDVQGGLKSYYIVPIANLTEESEYDIRVIFHTKEKHFYDKCILFTTAKTICNDSSQEVLIKDLKVIPDRNHILIKWMPVCRNQFNVIIKCGKDEWCTNSDTKFTVGSVDSNHTIYNLLPYTNYELEFSVAYSQKEEMQKRTFRTNPTEPLAVTELKVYSFSTEGISIRFKKPFPPYGELENYILAIECTKPIFHTTDILILAKSCELWDGYQCITISQDSYITCDTYHISIHAKNKDVLALGAGENIDFTTNAATMSPNNLTINEHKICWDHPDFINGILIKFEITYKQIETFLLLIEKKILNNVENEKVESFRKIYCHELKSDLLPSSKYEISVRAVSDKNTSGKPATKLYTTDPIQPKLVSNIIKLERTNSTQKIIIPPINSTTQTKTSVCYVTVCDPTATNNDHSKKFDKKLYKWSNCGGSFWVATKLNLSNSKSAGENIEFIIGNGSTTENKALRPEVDYTVSVLLVNEYDNMFSREIYSIMTSAPEVPPESNPALYLLLLLLLIIPVIGYFAYRKYRQPQGIRRAGTTFEEDSVQNNNVPMRNMVNTLAQLLPIPTRKNTAEQNEHNVPLMLDKNTNKPIYTRPVKINELSEYVKRSLGDGELERQHGLFPKGGIKSWDYGMAKQNKFKNRYNNLTAYDHSRVILNVIPGDPFSDFINANYIDGYHKEKAYIATQGPKLSTLNDFWRMIWQESVRCIIMLANLEEGNKKKCEKYWPDIGASREYFKVTVTFTHSDIFADYEFRNFEVRCDGKVRKVQQLHFTSWPDHGVPQYPQSLVPFLKKLLAVSTESPIVVHCSAGVGRTGTIILADICLRMAAVEGQIDVLKYMHSIREQRANLVDNFDQYKLVHMVLLECLFAPETSIPCENIAQSVQDLFDHRGLEKQMNYLKETAWHNQAKNYKEIEARNMSKNRFPDIIPNKTRLYLSRYPTNDEFSDYINAVPVDGFRYKNQFIVTQIPLPHTIKDFWRMIVEKDVKVIVSLNEIMINDKTCCTFWPINKDEQSKPVPYLTLSCQSIREENKYNVYNIQIQNSIENTELYVRLIQLIDWKKDQKVPENMETLISILEEAQNLSRQNPTVVACYDGSTASGLFVALSFVIEKIKLEQICDVCQAVRTVRINRPQFISQQVQFEFLYRTAVYFVSQFDDYSNFEGPRK